MSYKRFKKDGNYYYLIIIWSPKSFINEKIDQVNSIVNSDKQISLFFCVCWQNGVLILLILTFNIKIDKCFCAFLCKAALSLSNVLMHSSRPVCSQDVCRLECPPQPLSIRFSKGLLLLRKQTGPYSDAHANKKC